MGYSINRNRFQNRSSWFIRKDNSAKCLVSVVAASVAATAFASSQERPDTVMRQLEEVVVTGSNSAVGSNLIPYSVSVVGQAQLEATGQTQLLSVLSGEVPSLFVTQRGIFGFGVSNGGSGNIKLRGVGGDRASAVLMMVDGQPQFAGIYSHSIGDFYGKDNVERVEVLRGPGSVLYGSNAMAGVINVITRGPRKDGVETTLMSQYGSYNTWLTTASNSTRFGRFSSFATISYDRTDGNIKGMDFSQWSGYGKIGYDFSNYWKAGIDYTLMNFRGDDPVYPRLSDPESTAVFRQNVTRGAASAWVTNTYGNADGTIRVYYSYGNHYIDDPNHFHSLDDRFGVMAYENFNPWTGAAMTVGFDFDRYSGKIPMSGGKPYAPGSMQTIARKITNEYSPYLTLSQSFIGEMLVINAGLRMANSDRFGTQWVPQAGIVFNHPEGWTAKASAAMGYRNPSFRELYLYRMANPDLEPEKMWNYEVSLSKSFSHWFSIGVTAYYSRCYDMIQAVDMKNVNTGRFINKGIEVTASSHPLSNLRISASYSYLHTSLRDLTAAPRNQYFLGAEWQPLKWLSVSGQLKGVTDLYVAEGIDRQNYATLDLKLDFKVCRWVSLFARLDNVTDAQYVINRGYDMPGFTAMGGFKLNF